jgi:hypothetical protein
MNEMPPSWLAMVAVGLTIALFLSAAVAMLCRSVRVRTASSYCPWRARHVTVRYLTADGENPTHVVSCSAFPDPGVCGAPCVSGDGPGSLRSPEPADALLGG